MMLVRGAFNEKVRPALLEIWDSFWNAVEDDYPPDDWPGWPEKGETVMPNGQQEIIPQEIIDKIDQLRDFLQRRRELIAQRNETIARQDSLGEIVSDTNAALNQNEADIRRLLNELGITPGQGGPPA